MTQEESYDKLNLREFWSMSKWIFKLIFGMQPFYTSVYLVSYILENLRSLGNWFIFARTLDRIIETTQSPNPSLEAIYPYLAVMFAYNLTLAFLSLLRNYSWNVIRSRVHPQVRKALYTQLNSMGIQNLEQPWVNNKIHRANEYIYNVLPFMRQMIDVISNLVRAVAALMIVASFLPVLIPIVILSIVPYVLWDKNFRKLVYKFSYDNTEGRRKAGMSASDLSTAVKISEISITDSFKFLDKKFTEYNKWYVDNFVKILKKWMVGSSALRFLSDIVIFLGYIRIFQILIRGQTTIGSVTFYMTTLNNFQDSMMGAMNHLNDLFESSLQLKDIYLLFNTPQAFPDGDIVMEKLEKGPSIEFKSVSFKYPNSDKYVITNLDLNIRSGEKVAIVGPNGAGKTTLVKMLSRMYQTTDGEILINGANVNHLKAQDYHNNMGVLFQEFNTYPQLTVKENISLGNSDEEPDEVKIRLAAQAADVTAFVEEYPDKFDQTLSEKFKKGIRPSTGQWQKIAIARFFYRNAPLVIFDEPTASIDAVSEYNIFNKIYEFFENKTVIIISHRFSTVRNADRIIVMEKGKIVEEGDHNHLMALNGKYAEAFMLQAQGYVSNIT